MVVACEQIFFQKTGRNIMHLVFGAIDQGYKCIRNKCITSPAPVPVTLQVIQVDISSFLLYFNTLGRLLEF